MPRCAQHSSDVVDADFVVLRKSAVTCFYPLLAFTDCVGNQATGIRSITVDHTETAMRRKFDEDGFAVVVTQTCFP